MALLNNLVAGVITISEGFFRLFGLNVFIEKTDFNPQVEKFFICQKDNNERIIHLGSFVVYIDKR